MSADFTYLKSWIGHRPVILECIPSRSGMSMTVYDRGKRIFTVNGCGFDRIGTALGDFMEALFQPELWALFTKTDRPSFCGIHINADSVALQGATGFESMASIADAIGLKVSRSESKAGTLIIIEKGGL